MEITHLGTAKHASPINFSVSDKARVPANVICDADRPPCDNEYFELAGPRDKLFFAPENTRAGIVTCGGLCPGLNHVIRSLFMALRFTYGVRHVLGFRGGYQGLDPASGLEPIVLTPEFVEDIHKQGGTVLGTSRGPVDVGRAVDDLITLNVNILFTIGGDGTQRGANALYQEAKKRGYALAVVGIPKTIDNDVAFVSRTFGYYTAVDEAQKFLDRAHTEAHSVQNGIALVKLMGRHAGYIAAGATLASQEVNFTLIPEVQFCLDGPRGLLVELKKRIIKRAHAVIVVAEGAGQNLLGEHYGRDASGNVKLKDIGLFMRQRIESYFADEQIPIVIRYFDPSYLIRSTPAAAEDAVLCDVFARNAVHAAMAGKTGLVIGFMHEQFIHVPIELLVAREKCINPDDNVWRAVLACTCQPEMLGPAAADLVGT